MEMPVPEATRLMLDVMRSTSAATVTDAQLRQPRQQIGVQPRCPYLVAAALILIKIGDNMACFGSPERLGCWAALSPGNDESAGKRKSGCTRPGNNVIRYICECAIAARKTKSTPAANYKSLMVRKSHKKAIVVVAHKMMRLIYILLSRTQPYLDQAIDYAAISARKNAPRWVKQPRPSHFDVPRRRLIHR